MKKLFKWTATVLTGLLGCVTAGMSANATLVVNMDNATVAAGGTVNIPVSANDILDLPLGMGAGTTEFSIVLPPSIGTATIVGNDIQYVAPPGFSGVTSLVYLLSENGDDSEAHTGRVYITSTFSYDSIIHRIARISLDNTTRNIFGSTSLYGGSVSKPAVVVQTQGTAIQSATVKLTKSLGDVVCDDGSRHAAGTNPSTLSTTSLQTTSSVQNVSAQAGGASSGGAVSGGFGTGFVGGPALPHDAVFVGSGPIIPWSQAQGLGLSYAGGAQNVSTQQQQQQQVITTKPSVVKGRDCYQSVVTKYSDGHGSPISKAEYEAAIAGKSEKKHHVKREEIILAKPKAARWEIWGANDYTSMETNIDTRIYEGYHNQSMIGLAASSGNAVAGIVGSYELSKLNHQANTNSYANGNMSMVTGYLGFKTGGANHRYNLNAFAGYGIGSNYFREPSVAESEAPRRRIIAGVNSGWSADRGLLNFVGRGHLGYLREFVEGYTTGSGGIYSDKIRHELRGTLGARAGLNLASFFGDSGFSVNPFIEGELHANILNDTFGDQRFSADLGGGIAVSATKHADLIGSLHFVGLGSNPDLMGYRMSVLGSYRF